MQVALVYLEWFRRNSLFKMCIAAWNHERITKNPILGFKVIDVGTNWKLVSSGCYDEPQVCVYLLPFSR